MKLLILLLLSSCTVKIGNSNPANFKCTEQEMKKTESETLFCIQNGSVGYSDREDCYIDSMARNCTEKKDK
jgi:hypothetical protein